MASGVVVERDNIILDGRGFNIEGALTKLKKPSKVFD